MNYWKDDKIQFARLIAELNAAGVFQMDGVTRDLMESMDLDKAQILDIVERAEMVFEKAKTRT